MAPTERAPLTETDEKILPKERVNAMWQTISRWQFSKNYAKNVWSEIN